MCRELAIEEIETIIHDAYIGVNTIYDDILDIVLKCFEAAQVQQNQTYQD